MSSARLEIHHIGVSQGDSTLIIVRDVDKLKKKLTNPGIPGGLPALEQDLLPAAIYNNIDLYGTVKNSVLIDAGGDEMGVKVVDYMLKYGVLKKQSPATRTTGTYVPHLIVIITHMHDDHYPGLNNLLWRLSDAHEAMTPKPRLRNNRTTSVPRYVPKQIYIPRLPPKVGKDGIITGVNNETEGKMAKEFREALNKLATSGVTDESKIASGANNRMELRYTHSSLLTDTVPIASRTKKILTDHLQTKALKLDLGLSTGEVPITMYCVCADCVISSPNMKISIANKSNDMNGFSSCFILEYGSFRYYLCGDLAGKATPPVKSSHPDSETELSKALCQFFLASDTTPPKANEHKYVNNGYCTGFKASHHASDSSNTNNMLLAMKPLFAVISSGFFPRYHSHPTYENIERYDKTKKPQWITESSTENNSISNYFVTEIATKIGTQDTNLKVEANGKVIGSIIVRPNLESIMDIYSSAVSNKKLKVHIYGLGDLTPDAICKKRKKVVELKSVDSNTNFNAYYPYGYYEIEDAH